MTFSISIEGFDHEIELSVTANFQMIAHSADITPYGYSMAKMTFLQMHCTS